MKKSGLCLAALFLAACANPPEEGAAKSAAAAIDAPASCAPPSSFGGYLFWMEPPALPPGASLVLQPWFTTRPGMIEPVPAACLEGVALAGPATLEADGRTVKINADAAPGAAVQVEGRVGAASLTGRILVYLPEAQPLVGKWAQPEDTCAEAGAEPVRELIFHPDGTFSLTWTPFEIYKDYWGTYTFEAGVLTLIPDGGNHIPGDASLSGRVEVDSGALQLAPAVFGSPPRSRACAAPFAR
ncbi:MAG: hypothetical protein C0456_14465 [Hyphomonas sp.]|uniref:hypothetical protein n=1 Tax=Hyphomonas sp. TaxID=87 RepID=UPI001D2961E2|nr:hypothetical protein [Hyphomonas sp.]MBA4227828.1 hypothetical protein [Hyphomonas sp.]